MRFPMLCALALLAGCASHGGAGNAGGNRSAEQAAIATRGERQSDDLPRAPRIGGVNFVQQSDLVDFRYEYPPAAVAVPDVAAALKADLAKDRDEAMAAAADDRKQAAANGYPFHQHSYEAHWRVRADTRRFLSMLADFYAYTGGAHGISGFKPMLWDRQAGRILKAEALFTSPAAFGKAMAASFCAALDAARAEKRGQPVKADGDPFNACIDPMKQSIVPEAMDGGPIGTFTVAIAPYEAGPYVEGGYQISVPVSDAMLAAIRPEYRAAFRVAK